MQIDKCGILWVLDSGRIENFSPNPKTICQPKVLAYDLNNGDKLIRKYISMIVKNKCFSNSSIHFSITFVHNSHSILDISN